MVAFSTEFLPDVSERCVGLFSFSREITPTHPQLGKKNPEL